MANPNDNNRFNQNQFDPRSLLDGLDKIAVPQNKVGNLYREKTSKLQGLFEDLIANTYGIQEIDHVFIAPKLNRDGSLANIYCRAYFNTRDVTNGDIVRTGIGAPNGKRMTVVQMLGGAASGSGDFELSDKFKSVFAPLALSEDNNKLIVHAVPGSKDYACLDIDFFAMMSLALGISSNDPYDFSIITAKPLGGDDFLLLYSKFIEVGSGKRGRHKGRQINYKELDKEFARQNNHYSNGGDRRFN